MCIALSITLNFAVPESRELVPHHPPESSGRNWVSGQSLSHQVARVIKFQRRPVDLLPPLFDATVLWMSNNQLPLTDFERADSIGDLAHYAQI